jgi:hypothetical protein
MSWFKRKPTQQKQVEAAIKVGSNLYEHTVPEAEDALVTLQFGLSDSRYRYLMFCFAAMTRACGRAMTDCDAVVNDYLRFLVIWTSVENAQEFFGGPVDPQDAATGGGAYLQDFLNQWSTWFELQKAGKDLEALDLICAMIRSTESNAAAGKTDMQRLGTLAVQIDSFLPTMHEAFLELVKE